MDSLIIVGHFHNLSHGFALDLDNSLDLCTAIYLKLAAISLTYMYKLYQSIE